MVIGCSVFNFVRVCDFIWRRQEAQGRAQDPCSLMFMCSSWAVEPCAKPTCYIMLYDVVQASELCVSLVCMSPRYSCA